MFLQSVSFPVSLSARRTSPLYYVLFSCSETQFMPHGRLLQANCFIWCTIEETMIHSDAGRKKRVLDLLRESLSISNETFLPKGF